MRGLFIVLEGCDRSGKSTQCQQLVKRLQANGYSAQYRNFPNRTTQTGKMIDSYLRQATELDDHAVHLLFSANRWEAMKSIKDTLDAGITLVVDRYAFSGVAFSSAKGLDLKWCKQPDVGLLSPDMVVFLDLLIDEAEKRGGYGEERYEKRELQKKVRDQFLHLKDDTWKVVDAAQSMEDVENRIWSIVESSMSSTLRQDKPLLFNLWKD
ncbi:deoxythymidylate kinase [Phycomyces nitens]|nr:deoxythymidylate kinase [Phycomyces nitens]